jgi:DUF1365 family protein
VNSALYEGWVRHRRTDPVPHAFTYSVFLLYADLAEVDRAFDGRWLWSAERWNLVSFRRRDYLGDPSVPLDEAVRRHVAASTGRRPEGPIRLLAHPRVLGFVFNPVAFYYCFDRAGTRVETIVAEITNTPWRERHAYVLSPARDEGRGPRHRWRFRKEFHVSPFIDMDSDYDWRFTDPGAGLTVHMENAVRGGRFFDATLHVRRRPLDGPSCASTLLRFPLVTVKVIAAIYFEALRLRWKGARFHPHPARRGAPA